MVTILNILLIRYSWTKNIKLCISKLALNLKYKVPRFKDLSNIKKLQEIPDN